MRQRGVTSDVNANPCRDLEAQDSHSGLTPPQCHCVEHATHEAARDEPVVMTGARILSPVEDREDSGLDTIRAKRRT